MLLHNVKRYNPMFLQVRHLPLNRPSVEPRHLICFKDWTSKMITKVLRSAINLKKKFNDTHNLSLGVLANSKIMILQEVNEPVLTMAVSKGASFLGARDVNISDHLVWEYDYNGKIFGLMSDAIFVSTTTHMCVARFAKKSPVPVLCMKSRTHATIQALSTVMAITEIYETMEKVNIAWLGPPHPVLNSYLLLCPMLGANITFHCCCNECPVSPLLLKISQDMTKSTSTQVKECPSRQDCLKSGMVFISGPTCRKEKRQEFALTIADINQATKEHWVYFHTCPRGEEVKDDLFYHANSKTFQAFQNMHYITASLMAYCIKGHMFH